MRLLRLWLAPSGAQIWLLASASAAEVVGEHGNPAVAVQESLKVFVSPVEPPTNVTFHCHNLHDLLRWSYELPAPAGLRFRVNISSVERSWQSRPPAFRPLPWAPA